MRPPTPARTGGLASAGRTVLVLLIASLALSLTLARVLPRLLAADVERWPRIARVDVVLDLSRPPELSARGRYVLEDVRERELAFLLNRSLELVSARAPDGTRLEVEHGRSLRSRYHKEGRVVRVDLGRPPRAEGERVELDLAWRGSGDDGTSGRDWRGILLLAPDEMRFSEQTIALPVVPIDASSPAHAPTPGLVQLLLPREHEAFAPGRAVGASVAAPEGARAWAFELAEGASLGLVSGRYVRSESDAHGLRLVSLMKEDHAALGPAIVEAAARASAFYARAFGAAGGHTLGVCEIDSRGDSYNWAGYGMFVLERGALGRGVPQDKIGHEVAHLWFGQAVHAAGAGERFLTEGLAEYASWRWLEEAGGADAAREEARDARESWARAVHEREADPALSRVDFATDDYSVLAYQKGALAARAAEHALGRAAFDAALAGYVREHAARPATLEAFARALSKDGRGADALAPWLASDGHAHLELAGVAWDQATRRVSGRIVRAECPEGLDGPAPDSVALRASGGAGSRDARVELAGEGRFSIELEEEPAVLAIDPDAACAVVPCAPFVLRRAALVRSIPADGARDVPYALERIELEFDRPLAPLGERDARKIRSAVYRAADREGVDYPPIRGAELEREGRLLVLYPSSPMRPGKDQLLSFAGILEDTAGAPVDVALRFRTRESDDAEPPRVVACDPPGGAQQVDPALRRISITFSEPMSPGRGYSTRDVEALEDDGARFPLDAKSDSEWTADRRTLVYELGTALEAGAKYVLPLRGASFHDLAGNGVVAIDYSFRTR